MPLRNYLSPMVLAVFPVYQWCCETPDFWFWKNFSIHAQNALLGTSQGFPLDNLGLSQNIPGAHTSGAGVLCWAYQRWFVGGRQIMIGLGPHFFYSAGGVMNQLCFVHLWRWINPVGFLMDRSLWGISWWYGWHYCQNNSRSAECRDSLCSRHGYSQALSPIEPISLSSIIYFWKELSNGEDG